VSVLTVLWVVAVVMKGLVQAVMMKGGWTSPIVHVVMLVI
jgi:hypothetical protein